MDRVNRFTVTFWFAQTIHLLPSAKLAPSRIAAVMMFVTDATYGYAIFDFRFTNPELQTMG
jgi:hypothetical protein